MINSLISTLNIIITHKLNKLYLLNCTFTLMSYRAILSKLPCQTSMYLEISTKKISIEVSKCPVLHVKVVPATTTNTSPTVRCPLLGSPDWRWGDAGTFQQTFLCKQQGLAGSSHPSSRPVLSCWLSPSY